MEKRFRGNSKRAWLVSALVIAVAITMLIFDLASKNWQFQLDLNIVELLIIAITIFWWRTEISLSQESIRIKQLSSKDIPLSSILRLSVAWNPLTGYIAAIEYKLPNARRAKRQSFFASFYTEPKVFLKTLRKAMPKDVAVDLCQRCKKEMK